MKNKKPSVTPGNLQPKNNNPGVKVPMKDSFGKEFSKARKAGMMEFNYAGKKYTTRMKGESSRGGQMALAPSKGISQIPSSGGAPDVLAKREVAKPAKTTVSKKDVRRANRQKIKDFKSELKSGTKAGANSSPESKPANATAMLREAIAKKNAQTSSPDKYMSGGKGKIDEDMMMGGGKVKTYAKGGKVAMPMKGMKKPKSSSCK